MSIASINSNNNNIASSAVFALKNAETAIKQEASGLRATNPGDFVSERAIANSLARVVISASNAKDNLMQGADMLDSSYAIVDASRLSAERMSDILQKYQSPTVTARDLPSMQAELDGLVKQLESNSEAEYNGLKLLNGSFAGKTMLSTAKDEGILVYDITDKSQYTAYNKIGENQLLQKGSTVEAVTLMGATTARGSIALAGIQNGSELTIGDTKINILDKNATSIRSNQMSAGADAVASVAKLVKFLNTSSFEDVNKAVYSVNGTTNTTVDIEYTQPGSMGNDFSVKTKTFAKDATVYLKGGLDTRERATVKIDFKATENYQDTESVVLNGQKFTFSTSPVLATDLAIGATLGESLDNLFSAIALTDGPANAAYYAHDNGATTLQVTVAVKEVGSAGNEFSFNFTNSAATVETTLVSGQATSTGSKSATIGSLVDGTSPLIKKGEALLKGTKISTDDGAFDSKMVGALTSLGAKFTPGSAGNANNVFNPNSVQFKAVLNGEVYQTNSINLVGGNKTAAVVDGEGYNGLGNRLAANSILTFQKIGSNTTDAGFSLTVNDTGVTLVNKDSTEEVQQELNILVSDANKAIEKGNIAFGIIAPSKEIADFSLDVISKYGIKGFIE